MTDVLLYAATVLFWGLSWIAIQMQLGVVAPEVSVLYRFVIAAVMMLAFCVITGRRMRFGLREHGFIALQGLFLFSTNFCLIYLGSQYLASGLVSVAFSTSVVMNILGAAVLFRVSIPPRVLVGAGLGLAGITAVFWPEVMAFDVTRGGTMGLILCLLGTLSASLGMLTSARNQKHGLPLMQTNAYGMAYGVLIMALFCLARGRSFDFDLSLGYVASLMYLAVFGSVLAFWCYLTLVGRIGAGPAAYATVLFPVIALALSTWLEGYQWTAAAGLGVVLVLLGNALVLYKGRLPLFGRS
jgi:drug/metabolite transporter (DMT)-like permease